MKYVYIKAADNDAYMNQVANFRGADHQGDTAVDLYFDAAQGSANSGAYDKITLAITSGKEQEVMEFIGAALSGGASDGMVVIADAVAKVFVNGGITDVTSITRGVTGSKREVEAITNGSAVTRTLTASESGKLFTVNMSTVDNNVTLTLPTASTSAGVFYDFAFLVNCDDDADFILKTDSNDVDFYGYQVRGGADDDVLDVNGDASKLTIDADVAQTIEGMMISVLCDGANWHLTSYNPTVVGSANLVLSATV